MRSARARRPGRSGRRSRRRTASRSSSAWPSCSPARGATRSTQRPCSGSPRRATRPRSTRPASSSTSTDSIPTTRSRSSTPSSRSRPRASGTTWSTDRSRASSSRSRRSTSRPSRATCRPRRRCWATPSCGSRRRRPCSPTTTSCVSSRRRDCRPASSTSSPAGRLGRRPRARLVRISPASTSPGSTPVFQRMWKQIGGGIDRYKTYPRIVGETGGKDFIFAHPSSRTGRARGERHPRRVRVPGPEVLRGEPHVRAAEPVGGLQGPPRRRGRDHQDGRPAGLLDLHGRSHRRSGLRHDLRLHRLREGEPRRRDPLRRELRQEPGLLHRADRRRVLGPALQDDGGGDLRPGPLDLRLRRRQARRDARALRHARAPTRSRARCSGRIDTR